MKHKEIFFISATNLFLSCRKLTILLCSPKMKTRARRHCIISWETTNLVVHNSHRATENEKKKVQQQKVHFQKKKTNTTWEENEKSDKKNIFSHIGRIKWEKHKQKTHEAHVKLNVTLVQLPFQMSFMNIHVNE